MELTQNDYLEAARLVAECKPSRLKYVLEILRQGGIEIPEEVIMQTKQEHEASERSGIMSRRQDREKRYDKRWVKTDDPIILTLREAYLSGYKISEIAEASNITRTALYEYMVGRRQYSCFIEDRFIEGFKTLGIKYPPDAKEAVK